MIVESDFDWQSNTLLLWQFSIVHPGLQTLVIRHKSSTLIPLEEVFRRDCTSYV